MTDVAIIGAYGSAGVAVADRLIDEDLDITLIDNGDPGGGLCILRGCMPSKDVLSAAAHRYQVREDARLEPQPRVDLEAVIETKNEHVNDFAAHRRSAVHGLAEQENVEFIHGSARFLDDHTITVNDREISAEYIVIATGSTVNVPDLPGIDTVEYLTSADVLDASLFGDAGIVMGFGYIGLELVPYLSEAGGMDLTVIEHDTRPLDEADPAFGDAILELYREEFDVTILTETNETRVEATNQGVRLHTDRDDEHATIDGDQLFLFTGRRPNLDGLGIANTSLDPGTGWVEDTMQARDHSRTFVVGDVNGREPILHVAKEQGSIAAENILAHARGDSLRSYETLHHHVIFSALGVYPFVRLGHSEKSAGAAGIEAITATRDANSDGVFRTKNVPHGLAKLVVDPEGTVIGYQGLHAHADTMAKTMQVIIENDMTVDEIPARAYHPTLPEIIDGLIRTTRKQVQP